MIAGAHPARHVTEGSPTSLRASRTAVTIQSILRQRVARKPAPGHTWRGSPNGRAWSRSRLAHPHPYDSPCGSTVFCVRHWDLTPSVTQQLGRRDFVQRLLTRISHTHRTSLHPADATTRTGIARFALLRRAMPVGDRRSRCRAPPRKVGGDATWNSLDLQEVTAKSLVSWSASMGNSG